jgi:hypothetical protein
MSDIKKYLEILTESSDAMPLQQEAAAKPGDDDDFGFGAEWLRSPKFRKFRKAALEYCTNSQGQVCRPAVVNFIQLLGQRYSLAQTQVLIAKKYGERIDNPERGLGEATNHMGDREYQTWGAWRKAALAAGADRIDRKDEDGISYAWKGDRQIGNWGMDSEFGVLYVEQPSLGEDGEFDDMYGSEVSDRQAHKDMGMSKDEETGFHKELDRLVHNAFGKRADEGRDLPGYDDWLTKDLPDDEGSDDDLYCEKCAEYSPIGSDECVHCGYNGHDDVDEAREQDEDEAYERYRQDKVDRTMPDGRSEWEHMGHGWKRQEPAAQDGVDEDATDPKNLDMTDLDFGEMEKEPLDFTESLRREWANYLKEGEASFKIEKVKSPNGQRPKGIGWELKKAGEQTGKDYSVWERKVKKIIEGIAEAKPNRELYDRIRQKGVVPSIDKERYTDMSDQGLEGPFRQKNGQVLYYDPREGSYYDRNTDMFVSQEDFDAMNEEQVTELSHDTLQQYVDSLDSKRIHSDPASRQGFGRALNKMHSPEHVKIPAYRTRKENDIESDYVGEGDPDIPLDQHLAMKNKERHTARDHFNRAEPFRMHDRSEKAVDRFAKRQPVEEYGGVNPPTSQPAGAAPSPQQVSQDAQKQQQQPMGSNTTTPAQPGNADQQTDDMMAKFGKAMQDPSAANQMKQILQKISL